MDERVLNKNCFIRKNRRLYCSKCGQMQRQDMYNCEKHAKICFSPKHDLVKIVNDGEGLAYAFRIAKDSLYFNVLKVELQQRRGFSDKYCGAKWSRIFEAVFERSQREVRQAGQGSVDEWFRKIDEKGMDYLNGDHPIGVIHHYFPNILGIESYQMFLEIYRQKGYNQRIFDVEEECTKPLWKENGEEYDTIHSFEKEGELFLAVDFGVSTRPRRIIVSKNFCYSKDCFAVDELLHGILLPKSPREKAVVTKFVERYPETALGTYLESGGRNLLMPFLSGSYDKVFELLTKSGLGSLANCFFELKQNNELDLMKNNLKDIFGMSVKTLRKIQRVKELESNYMFLLHAYQKNPAFVEMEYYSEGYMDCLRFNDFSEGYHGWRGIPGIQNWSDKEILRVLKYLDGYNAKRAEHNQSGVRDVYTYYRDYIGMCQQLEQFEGGHTPTDLRQSHDNVYHAIQRAEYRRRLIEVNQGRAMYQENPNRQLGYREVVSMNGNFDESYFTEAISKKEYASLASNYVEPVQESFQGLESQEKPYNVLENEDYVILLPKESSELEKESSTLHHCVRVYKGAVALGQTYILFLRKKKEISTPFATMEVMPNKTLVQLKAVCNAQVPEDAKVFVRKWARIKGVTIQSRDIKNDG
ncbi:MAG: PcfJ domain-containing protein [Lachnospiraceae bacterium]